MNTQERGLLEEITRIGQTTGSFPAAIKFLAARPDVDSRITELQRVGMLRRVGPYLVPTLAGLKELPETLVSNEFAVGEAVVAALQQRWASHPEQQINNQQYSVLLGFNVRALTRTLLVLASEEMLNLDSSDVDNQNLVFSYRRSLHGLNIFQRVPDAAAGVLSAQDGAGTRLQSLTLNGWAPFPDFHIDLDPLTVLVGPNASGKSSLGRFLAWMGWMADHPIPGSITPEDDLRSVLIAGRPPELRVELGLLHGDQTATTYSLDYQAAEGRRGFRSERWTLGEYELAGREPGEARMRLPGAGVQILHVQNQESMLRWARPGTGPNALRELLSSVRVYGAIDTSGSAAIRAPQPVQAQAVLDSDGSNLVAVLHLLYTDRERWPELESVLRSAVPGFVSLKIKPTGRRGQVAGFWHEDGISGDLELADLSDGTLRLLCWLAICLSARPGQLIVADEPEQGLHPRVMALLGDLLGMAAESAQVIVMTHSPDLLARFPLDSVRVLRKEDGIPRAYKPADSAGLRSVLEDSIGGIGLAELFRTSELEELA